MTDDRLLFALVFGIAFVTILLSYITMLLHRIENKDTVPNILGVVLGTIGAWVNGLVFAVMFSYVFIKFMF